MCHISPHAIKNSWEGCCQGHRGEHGFWEFPKKCLSLKKKRPNFFLANNSEEFPPTFISILDIINWCKSSVNDRYMCSDHYPTFITLDMAYLLISVIFVFICLIFTMKNILRDLLPDYNNPYHFKKNRLTFFIFYSNLFGIIVSR